jgi:hypothetical protein
MEELLQTFIQNSDTATDLAYKLLQQEPSPESNKQARILLTEAKIWIAAGRLLNAKLSEFKH